MYLDKSNYLWKKVIPVLYDLEYSGDVQEQHGKQCAIWEIAAKSGNNKFHVLINPYKSRKQVPPAIHERYKMPTKEEFIKLNAVSFQEGIYLFDLFLQSLLIAEDQHILLTSHNAFRGDKLVLEHELVRHRVHLHILRLPIFFFDTLHFIRSALPKQKSYSLGNLYLTLTGKPFEGAHAAANDVQALDTVLKTINKPLNGVVTLLFLTPFSNINGIGLQTEKKILKSGYTCLEHFFCINGLQVKPILNALIQMNIFTDIATINKIAHEMHLYGFRRLIG